MDIEPKLQAIENEYDDIGKKLADPKIASNSGKFGLCIIAPFLTLQFLTTREPNINQAEVALVSLDTALEGGINYVH